MHAENRTLRVALKDRTDVLRLVRKYWRLLANSAAPAMAHVKIMISFIVVLLSVDVQFGIAWPKAFVGVIDALAVFTFDFGILTGIFCLVNLGALRVSNRVCS